MQDHEDTCNADNDLKKIPEENDQLIVAKVCGQISLSFKNSGDKINTAKQQPDKRDDECHISDGMKDIF